MVKWFVIGLIVGTLYGAEQAAAAVFANYQIFGQTSGGVAVPVKVDSTGHIIIA